MNKKIKLQLMGFLLLLIATTGMAQKSYKIHAHNDYEKEFPFWAAYVYAANSIEADVFLKDETLYVTHAESKIDKDNTLQTLYLKPIAELSKTKKLRDLQLLIDVKSEAYATLEKIVEVVEENPELRTNIKLHIVISGNRPAPEDYKNYPDFIQFDHQSLDDLDKIDLNKVAMISLSFGNYSTWNGKSQLAASDLEKVKEVIKKAHKARKPFRFWGTPDTETAWSTFAKLGVDFINTDDPAKASDFLKQVKD